ncbi:SDR family oxidoreductase [Permianibacter sp. IMCC34836]|uniref:SDR family NAD(P)-dependent oxidoreductase n=1 Tax=Permianibacter fluminis TaxID=2738515 RepID=UPI0015571EFB|nr:SDR family oxidoreductase [Permianibacter fluminis]NQD35425.1 SDR family oxidoreductase [Permianibacter fluminis]
MANILVIGGSRGIGRALVEQLLLQHHAVWLACREPEHANDLHAAVRFRWDALTEPFPREQLPERLHGLAYCPGSINLKPFSRLNEQDFLRDWELNCLGAVRAVQACLPALKAADQAAIVFFSSVAAQTGLPFHASIAAAKGAIEGLTRALAAELAPAITVNAIAPALIDTPLAQPLLSSDSKRQQIADRNPMKTIGAAATVAALASGLLTAAQPFMTGQVLALDGGLSRLR